MKKLVFAGFILLLALALTGCSRSFLGGAAVGAGGTGAVYEYRTKKALDELEKEFEAGKISKEEYLRRKKDIQDRSLIY